MEGKEENKNDEAMEIDEDAINRDIAVVSKLDDFCCSGEFTSWVGEFQNTHCGKFTLNED